MQQNSSLKHASCEQNRLLHRAPLQNRAVNVFKAILKQKIWRISGESSSTILPFLHAEYIRNSRIKTSLG